MVFVCAPILYARNGGDRSWGASARGSGPSNRVVGVGSLPGRERSVGRRDLCP